MAKNYFNTMVWANMIGEKISVRFAPNVTMNDVKRALTSCNELEAEIYKSDYKPGVLVVRGNLRKTAELGWLPNNYQKEIGYCSGSHHGNILELYEPGFIRNVTIITMEAICAKLLLIRKRLVIVDIGGKLLDYQSLCDMGLIVSMESAPTGTSYFEVLYDDNAK